MTSTSQATPFRLLSYGILFVVGILPSLLFFIWIERNSTLPVLPISWAWPWVDFRFASPILLSLFDFSLFLMVFGIPHSVLARTSIKTVLQSRFPRLPYRIFYNSVAGLTLFIVMSFWQNTGIHVWSFSTPVWLSPLLFVSLLAAAGMILISPDSPTQSLQDGAWNFLGVGESAPHAQSESPPLKSHLPYRLVRHPSYLLLLLAVFLTPQLSLDRLTFGIALITYFGIAVPLEEADLFRQFGQAYHNYRKGTPAGVLLFFNRM